MRKLSHSRWTSCFWVRLRIGSVCIFPTNLPPPQYYAVRQYLPLCRGSESSRWCDLSRGRGRGKAWCLHVQAPHSAVKSQTNTDLYM